MADIIDLKAREVDALVEGVRAIIGDESFSVDTIRETVRRLLSRARWKLFRRLTCFVATVCERRLEPVEVLYAIPPYSAAYKARFEAGAPVREAGGRVELRPGGVVLGLDADASFETLYSAMGRLCCALHAVAEVMGCDRVLARVEEIAAAPLHRDALNKIAADWMADFDAAYRKANELDEARKKMERVLAHLLETRGGGFSYRDVGPEDVLAFWLKHAEFEDLNVRRYAKAHEAFVAFVDRFAAETSAYAERHGESIQEEDDPERGVASAARRIAEEDALGLGGARAYEDWVELADELGEIKMLVGRQMARLKPYGDLPPAADHLMLSLLRVETFGPIENVLIQAKRDGRAMAAPDDPETDYTGAAGQIADVAENFDASCWASVHVLYENDRSNAIWAIAHLSDEAIDWLALARELDVELDPQAADPLAPLLAAVRRQSAPPQAVAEGLRAAEHAWRSFERKGFLKAQLYADDVVDQLDLLTMRMPGARAHVRDRSGKLEKIVQTRASFEDDLRTFNEAFSRLYGLEGDV